MPDYFVFVYVLFIYLFWFRFVLIFFKGIPNEHRNIYVIFRGVRLIFGKAQHEYQQTQYTNAHHSDTCSDFPKKILQIYLEIEFCVSYHVCIAEQFWQILRVKGIK